jgi:hypothetical protein
VGLDILMATGVAWSPTLTATAGLYERNKYRAFLRN